MSPLTETNTCLSLLRCPDCGTDLTSVMADEQPTLPARLQCQSCQRTFPCINDVIRFVKDDSYTTSFSHQWNRFKVQQPEEDTRTFKAKTGLAPAQLAGKQVLDAGCGGGRYAALLGQHGVHALAMDLSQSVERAADLCNSYPTVSVIQASLFEIPLTTECFDFAFSIGVLHHSPDPRKAFHELAARVKPGGQLAIWLYRRNTFIQEQINHCLRWFSTRFSSKSLEKVCYLGAVLGGIPLLNRTLNKIANFSNHPNWEIRVCDTFDWYSPRYQSHHTLSELKQWFEEEGFSSLRELPPEKSGRFYLWAYNHDFIIGSGVNVLGTKNIP